jgi:hypothetical protein
VGSGPRAFSGSSAHAHLPLFAVEPLPKILTLLQPIFGGFFFLLAVIDPPVFGNSIWRFNVPGKRKPPIPYTKYILIHFMNHLSKLILQRMVLVYQYLFGLILEQIFNTGNMDLFTVFLLVFDLSDVQSQRFQTTCVQLLICCDLVKTKTPEAYLAKRYFRYC